MLKPNPHILTSDHQQVEFCLKLIREENQETEQAVKNKDYVETVDGLVDQLYVICGMLARICTFILQRFIIWKKNLMN